MSDWFYILVFLRIKITSDVPKFFFYTCLITVREVLLEIRSKD